MSRWYGSVNNRIREGKNYLQRELKVGDDITMYLWSDRLCFYITDVVNQKHIKVQRYQVCADHSKESGIGHQDWLYFKTTKEYNEYINSRSILKDKLPTDVKEPEPENWVFRYGKWKEMITLNIKDTPKVYMNMTDKQKKDFEEGKDVHIYKDLLGSISFGVREYYYDWSF